MTQLTPEQIKFIQNHSGYRTCRQIADILDVDFYEVAKHYETFEEANIKKSRPEAKYRNESREEAIERILKIPL